MSHAEKLVSALGGFIAIFCILTISRWSVGAGGAALIVASMGASAVLLFAVPHGLLSQPWPVLGGHIISAVIGVSCAKFIPNEVLAASVAVGAAIGVMYYARCTHPPGGATALSAVVGGQAVHELGYQFVLTPILLNVLIILAIGFSFNFLFPWRRYPSSLHRKMSPPETADKHAQTRTIAHEDFVYALSELDTFIDINEDDLIRIYDIATQTAHHHPRSLVHLATGRCYSNGKYGEDWSVRQVLDISADDDKANATVSFKIMAGSNRRKTRRSTYAEFQSWLKYRVKLDEENWKRVDDTA
ncbi:MAG: HPP family protein [Granulosicoccus sp.]